MEDEEGKAPDAKLKPISEKNTKTLEKAICDVNSKIEVLKQYLLLMGDAAVKELVAPFLSKKSQLAIGHANMFVADASLVIEEKHGANVSELMTRSKDIKSELLALTKKMSSDMKDAASELNKEVVELDDGTMTLQDIEDEEE